MKTIKILGLGLINYVFRFAIGGVLFTGIKINPEGFLFGFILTVVAFLATFVLLKFVMKPQSAKEGFGIILVWFVLTLILDALTAKPIVQVDLGYLFKETQFWTRSLIMFVVIPFSLKKNIN